MRRLRWIERFAELRECVEFVWTYNINDNYWWRQERKQRKEWIFWCYELGRGKLSREGIRDLWFMEWERCTAVYGVFIGSGICVIRLRFDVVEYFGCLSILISNTINLKTPNFPNNNYQMKVIKCHYHLIITVQPNIISNRGSNRQTHFVV